LTSGGPESPVKIRRERRGNEKGFLCDGFG